MKNPPPEYFLGDFLYGLPPCWRFLSSSKTFPRFLSELFILIRGLAVLNSSAGLECFKPFLTAVNSQLLFFGAVLLHLRSPHPDKPVLILFHAADLLFSNPIVVISKQYCGLLPAYSLGFRFGTSPAFFL